MAFLVLENAKASLIARSGWRYAFLTALLIVAVYFYAGLIASLFLLPIPFLMLYLFRDPSRHIPPRPLAIVSPCDGIVESVSSIYDRYINREAIKIHIRMSIFDVYTMRSPIEGKVEQQWYRQQRDGGEGPHFAQWIQTDEEDSIVVLIYPHRLTGMPRCKTNIGERIGQGQACSYISFGADIEVWVPANAYLLVENGQRVVGGESVLADFIHKKLPV